MANESHIDTISPAEFVIGVFGGLTATARAVGLPVTTVQGWKDRGKIPQDHWNKLISAAKAERDRDLQVSDLFNRHPVEAPAEAVAS
jgi:hypothetical protein